MNVYEARWELRKMNKRDLFRLASDQRISRCLIGGGTCGFYLSYKGFSFCVSEILGQNCLLERERKLERPYENLQNINRQLLLMDRLEIGPLGREKRDVEFKIYYRDWTTRSIIHLGKVMERRAKERGNNLNDLLVKVINDYSDCVTDPSKIFLLSP